MCVAFPYDCPGGLFFIGTKPLAGEALSASSSGAILISTQEADGHWPQNMWLDGKPYWSGIQIDETAGPYKVIPSKILITLGGTPRDGEAGDGASPYLL